MKNFLIVIFAVVLADNVCAQCNTCLGRKVIERTETCTYCQGKGSFTETVSKDCENCYGKGVTTHQCATCIGVGEVSATIVCFDCNGTRYISEMKKCTVCLGTGTELYSNSLGENDMRRCSNCKGEKYVQRSSKCRKCNATGSVSGTKTCPTCNGLRTSTKTCYSCNGNRKKQETHTRICNNCRGNRELKRTIPCPICSRSLQSRY